MKNEEVNKIKIEQAQKALNHYVAVVVSKEASILYVKESLAKLNAKDKLSQQDKQDKKNYEANISADTEDLQKAQLQVDVFCSLIETYSKNETVQL